LRPIGPVSFWIYFILNLKEIIKLFAIFLISNLVLLNMCIGFSLILISKSVKGFRSVIAKILSLLAFLFLLFVREENPLDIE